MKQDRWPDLFQLRQKILIRHLVEAQVENMELDILAIPPLTIADELTHLPLDDRVDPLDIERQLEPHFKTYS